MSLRLVHCAFFLALAIGAPVLAAQELTPALLLKKTTADVIEIAKQSRGNFTATRGIQIEELVERKIAPIFDFARMTESAMDGNWRLASPAQRSSPIAEFRTLLVRTYTVALRNYRDETFEFEPSRTPPGATYSTVRSIIRQAGTARATIDYDMQKSPTGWRVYEIRIDGVNLIANYRPSFAARVRDGGVDSLIGTLADKNRQSNYSGAPSRAAAREDPA